MKDVGTASGASRILLRLREQGPVWIWRRLKVEFSQPSTRLGRVLHRVLGKSLSAIMSVFRADARDGVLYAFYDLEVEPVTFDFLWFLAAAEATRRRRGLDRIQVVIVPGHVGGLREEEAEYGRIVDQEARRWRLQNILIPAVSVLPGSPGLAVLGDRAEAHRYRDWAGDRVYPARYEPSLPTCHRVADVLTAEGDVGSFRATAQSHRYVQEWLQPRAAGRRVVTITLREYAYMPDRNSNVAAWVAFARRLDPSRYFPVFLPDAEQALKDRATDLGDLPIFMPAVFTLGLRMALYEEAWVNLGINNGPVSLCWLNSRVRYISFKLMTPSVPQTTEAVYRERGFNLYQPLPFAREGQRWVWEEDDLSVIEREFAAFGSHLLGGVSYAATSARDSQPMRQNRQNMPSAMPAISPITTGYP
jgi:hypothetical protein